MAGVLKNLTAGDNKNFRVSVFRKDPLTGKPDLTTPISLTGNRVEFTMKEAASDAQVDALIYKSSDNGASEVEIQASPNDNQAIIKLLPADSATRTEGDYPFDVQVTIISSSQKHTVVLGLICISEGVTDT